MQVNPLAGLRALDFTLYTLYNAPLCWARSWQLGTPCENHSCCLRAISSLGGLPLFFYLWIIIHSKAPRSF